MRSRQFPESPDHPLLTNHVHRLISQVIPAEASTGGVIGPEIPDGMSAYAARPPFSVGTMSNNFRRFNARIGVVFKFQARVVRLLSWRKPTHTLSLLSVYTFVCLDPSLLFVLPIIIALVTILIPSFIARHPAPTSEDRLRDMDYRPRGPPLAPARTVKPAKELSSDFFKNLGHLQNSMEDFSVVHDQLVGFVVPNTNFSDEALSSAIFVMLCLLAGTMSLTAHLIPWRYLALVAGWIAICSGHPGIGRLTARLQAGLSTPPTPTIIPSDVNIPPAARLNRNPAPPLPSPFSPTSLPHLFKSFAKEDIILSSTPETREVEIFELQHLDASTQEWEPWLFSPSPHDPLSPSRISNSRPKGTRFFEDVLPPPGWEWSEKKWALDLWSREWVEERIITGVEVETEGERWVYDILNEHEGETGVGVVDFEKEAASGGKEASKGRRPEVSWEEGEEATGRRGEWRRRRWVRLVRRKAVGANS